MEKELMAKAFVFHASRKFHKSRLSTSSQTTVKFVKDKLEEKENIPEKTRILLVPQVVVSLPVPLSGILQSKL